MTKGRVNALGVGCRWADREAQLNVFSGRETIVVDRRPVFDKINWRPRNEVPIDLRDGREAKALVSARWGSPLGAF